MSRPAPERRRPPLSPLPGALALGLILIVAEIAIGHPTAQTVLDAFLVPVLIAATLTDLHARKIPNRLTAPAAIWALVLGAALRPSGVPAQALAALAAGGFMLISALLYPKGLGMGDVKLAATIGLYLSASVAVALLVGLLASALAGVLVIFRYGLAKGRAVALPLAPFLALGGAVAILAGPQLIHWYI